MESSRPTEFHSSGHYEIWMGYAEEIGEMVMLSVATGLTAPLYLWMPSAAVAKQDRSAHHQSVAGLAAILLLPGLCWNMSEHYRTNSERRDTGSGIQDDSSQDGESDDKDHDGNNDDNHVDD